MASSIRFARSRRGFTLIEMIVAAVVLFVGVTAALMCISSATRAAGVSTEYQTAALLAQRRFGEIEAQPDTELTGGSHNGSFGDDYSTYSWDDSVDTTDIQNLVKVTLNITWQSGAGQRSAQFVTFEAIPSTSTAATGTSAGGA